MSITEISHKPFINMGCSNIKVNYWTEKVKTDSNKYPVLIYSQSENTMCKTAISAFNNLKVECKNIGIDGLQEN